MRVSLQSQLLRVVLRVLVKRRLRGCKRSVEAYVPALRRAYATVPKPGRVASDVRIVPISVGDVRGEWVLGRGAAVGSRAILYVHGGAFVAGEPADYRGVTSALALYTGLPVFVPAYRHAPEHRFPAALDDVLAAYGAIRTRIGPPGIALAGDGAGGNLVFAALLALRRRSGEARPVAAVIAFSPWTDLTAHGASLGANQRSEDALALQPGDTLAAGAYADETQLREPLVSPLYGDYAHGPPLLLFASTTEIRLDDARALVARVRAQGALATLIQAGSMPHAWPTFPALPEARRAYVTVTDFLERTLHAN